MIKRWDSRRFANTEPGFLEEDIAVGNSPCRFIFPFWVVQMPFFSPIFFIVNPTKLPFIVGYNPLCLMVSIPCLPINSAFF